MITTNAASSPSRLRNCSVGTIINIVGWVAKRDRIVNRERERKRKRKRKREGERYPRRFALFANFSSGSFFKRECYRSLYYFSRIIRGFYFERGRIRGKCE